MSTADYPPISRDNPLEQVLAVSRELAEIQRDESRRQAMIQWWHAFVAEMPHMNFHRRSASRRAHIKSRVWGALGALIYYFLNPTHNSFHTYCPEAIRCYEEAARNDPDPQAYFKKTLAELKYYEPKASSRSAEEKG